MHCCGFSGTVLNDISGSVSFLILDICLVQLVVSGFSTWLINSFKVTFASPTIGISMDMVLTELAH